MSAPSPDAPTKPVDYAALSGTYLTLLAAHAWMARNRPAMRDRDLVPLSVASFALAKLIVHEKVETWLRQPFVEEVGVEERKPRGKRLRYVVGELLTCTRCMGAWSALGLVALRTHSPETGRAVTHVLAASAGNDFLQGAFTLLTSKSNVTETIAGDLQRSA